MKSRLKSVALIILVFALAGCVTTPKRSSGGTVVETNDDITITARYYDRAELNERYSERYVPFVAPPMLLTPTEFLVFDMRIETANAGSVIDTSEIRLDINDNTYWAMSPPSLLRFWEGTAMYEDITGFNRTRFEQRINREMITRPPSEKNGVALGLAVFRGRRFPAEGIVRISVPVTDIATGRTRERNIAFELRQVGDGGIDPFRQ